MIKRIYLLLMLIGGCLFSMRAAIKEEIYVNHIADTVEFGNEFLTRKFLVKNDKVRTYMIENKRMGKQVSRIIPEATSEDFIIRTLSADSVVAEGRIFAGTGGLRIFVLRIFFCREYRSRMKERMARSWFSIIRASATRRWTGR